MRVAAHLNNLIPKSLLVNFIKVNVIKMFNKSKVLLFYLFIYFLVFHKSYEKNMSKNWFFWRSTNCAQNPIQLSHRASAWIINIPIVAFFESIPHTSFCFHKHSLLQEMCINPQLKILLKKSNVYTHFNNGCRKFWAFILKKGGIHLLPIFFNLCLGIY